MVGCGATNGHLRAGEYQQALEVYSRVVNEFSRRVMIETIRVARCNRAAC
jgi:hypothetical protein